MHAQKSIEAICLAYTQAMFAAQQLEDNIVFILTFYHGSCPDSPEEVLKIINTAREAAERLPLGQLIKPLKGRIVITSHQEALLADALKIRNDLAHNFLGENYQKIIDRNHHVALVCEIKSASATINLAANELKPYLTDIYTAFAMALVDKPETAETTKLQSLLERLRDPEEIFCVGTQ